jgi:hypothetical protein
MKILSILPLMLFAAIVANAQEVVSYRGAFAPAPTRQWTESWTEFSPETIVYPATNVTVTGPISTNTTWTANNVYLLSGVVYVDNGATLTIEPGTIIRGQIALRSCLVITRGSKIMAEGTQCKPIIFTSNEPVGTGRKAGNWAGVVILGAARNNISVNNNIEGLPNTDARNLFGGTDDDDNSGVMKYVRIEFAGDILSVTTTGNELNSLTMGSVGRGTELDYIQCSFGLDDSFEWFGGTVNAKHLIAYKGLDDDMDTDNGYSGTVQFALCIKDPNASDASQSEGFESDNSSTGIEGLLPKTSAKFLNITQIGGFRCASNTAASGVAPTALFLHRRGARVRRNSDLKIQNSILMNNWRGLFVDNAIVTVSGVPQPTAPTTINYNQDSAVFRNNIIAGDFTTTWNTGATGTYIGTKSLAYENPATRTIGALALYANDSINTCSLLANAWAVNPNLADFRPNAVDGALVTDVTLLSNGADLAASALIDNASFTANQSQDFVIVVGEQGVAASSGTISITVFKAGGWDLTFDATATNSSFGGGTPINNGAFTFVDNGGSITITSKPGTIVNKGDVLVLGLTLQRKAGTGPFTNQNVGVDIVGGGDITPANNSTLLSIGSN